MTTERFVKVTRCPHCNATDSASVDKGSYAYTQWGWVSFMHCTLCDGDWYVSREDNSTAVAVPS